MRILKVVGIVLACLVGAVVLLLIAVRLFVDPNDYKDRIARTVMQSTGRELALPGTIKMSVFPWIALELGPASLGNPPGFGTEPFAAVQRAVLRVRLLPLLHKELEIGRVEISGLDLRLRKNAAGKGNWDLGGEHPAATPQTSDAASMTALRNLAGIVITDSRLSYQDLVAEHVNLRVGRVAGGMEVPVQLKLTLTPSAGARPIEVGGQLNVTLEPADSRYRLAQVNLGGNWGSAAGATRVAWKFSAPQAELDLGAQTLGVARVSAQFGAARLNGTLKGSRIVDAPDLAGSFRLEPLPPRELMSQLGIAPPKTRDAKALGSLAASGEFAYADKRIALSKLEVRLDESRLRGSAAITNLDTKAMQFDLSLDRIDIDRYRPPPEKGPKPPAAATGTGPAETKVLKTLALDGTFTLGAATFAGLHLTDGRMKLVARDGVTHIAPLTARLYGGTYSGDVTLDDRGSVLMSKFQQNLTRVDMAQLLKDFAKSQRFSGLGTVSSSLTARGSGGDAVLRSLNGHVTANLDKGAIEGVDLGFEIGRALALVQKQTLTGGPNSGRTVFDTFTASADIVNGVATTKDLNIASQNLRVSGQGTANLVTEAIDYQLKAAVLKQATGAAGAGGATLADIPLAITGSISSPKVRPDLEGLARQRVQQELNKHKDQLQQKLKDQLKGLINK